MCLLDSGLIFNAYMMAINNSFRSSRCSWRKPESRQLLLTNCILFSQSDSPDANLGITYHLVKSFSKHFLSLLLSVCRHFQNLLHPRRSTGEDNCDWLNYKQARAFFPLQQNDNSCSKTFLQN